MNLLFIYGTRPEAIKLGPIVAALRAGGEPPKILATGQHTDLLEGTPAETDLAGGDSLGLRSDGNVPKYLTHATEAIQDYLSRFCLPLGAGYGHPPVPIVVVQGDTMSTLAGALAAHERGFPIAHVEAGVRSGDRDDPWPEELNRLKITSLATWHYAASTTAYANLLAEGVLQRYIRLTGNPGISALARYTDARPIAPPEPTILVTLHRRELLRRAEDWVSVLDGLRRASEAWPQLQFCWPVHPGVLNQIPLGWAQSLPKSFVLIDPLPYRKMALLLSSCTGVITDSGGVQEEAAALGVPCICLRKVTDRPESIEAGVAARMDTNAVGVTQGVEMLARGRLERRPIDVYGDVTAADLIARHLGNLL